MEDKAILKEVLNEAYDEALHARFILWKDQSGSSLLRIAKMLNRSTAAVSQYINKKYEGSVADLEMDIASLLRREEDLEFVTGPEVFCPTTASVLIWEVMQYCDSKCKMGVIVGPSGIGKTECAKEYKKQYRASVFFTLDPTLRRPSAVLGVLAAKIGWRARRTSIAELREKVVDRLTGSRRLIIVDEAHFLQWESFEVLRKIHDCAGVGIIYLGQERLYDQMKGNTDKAFLYDQIYRRISIKRDHFPVKKDDAKLIVESICPGLDKASLDFLYKKCRGRGRFGTMKELLEAAMEMRKNYGKALNVELLREAEEFLMI